MLVLVDDMIAMLAPSTLSLLYHTSCRDNKWGSERVARMRSVPGAVATGSQRSQVRDGDDETRSLPLPVLTSRPIPEDLVLRKLRNDLAQCHSPFFNFFRAQRNSTHHRMSAAAIAFADGG